MVYENGVFNSIRKLNGDQTTHLCNCIKQPMASNWEAKNSKVRVTFFEGLKI
jgi:hypothetical protein